MQEIQAFATKFLDSTMEPVTLELLSPTLSRKLTGQSCYTVAIGLEEVYSILKSIKCRKIVPNAGTVCGAQERYKRKRNIHKRIIE